jgi:two-component system sensor histidine kinase KdpD
LQDAIRRVERHRKLEFCATILGSCTAAADPVLLSQCFYNIIDNAAKYASPSNSLDIRTQSMGGYCRIEIADGGPGLPEKDQESIFSSFYLGANGKDLGGTGLGLAIVRGLVESMGGSVSAQNRLDGHSGLRVVVELPEKS